MADRDKDVALLNKLAKGRVISFIFPLVGAGLMWILALVTSFLGAGRQSILPSFASHLIIVAFCAASDLAGSSSTRTHETP